MTYSAAEIAVFTIPSDNDVAAWTTYSLTVFPIFMRILVTPFRTLVAILMTQLPSFPKVSQLKIKQKPSCVF